MSPAMALRIEAWLGVERGGRADIWLAGQVAYVPLASTSEQR